MDVSALTQGRALLTLFKAGAAGFVTLHEGGKNPDTSGFYRHPITFDSLLNATVEELEHGVGNLGLVPGPKIVVLDVDRKNHIRSDGSASGIDGLESLRAWESLFGPIPSDTLTTITASDGLQRFYRLPEEEWGCISSGSNLGAAELNMENSNLDCKSGNAICVLAGSETAQGKYRWLDGNAPILEANESLLSLLRSRGAADQTAGRPKKKTDTPARTTSTRTAEEDQTMLNDVLSHITCPDYHTWIKIGQCLAGEGFNQDVYEAWTKNNGASFETSGPNSAAAKWASFLKGEIPSGGAGLATIFYEAKKRNALFRVPDVFLEPWRDERLRAVLMELDDDEDE